MDLDAAGSEAALFEQIRLNTRTIVDAVQSVRPDVDLMVGSYDYPNFDVGFWCFTYACPKREDLSRDPNNDLITNAELNDMMVRIETQRVGWANSDSRLHYDHSVGLMHHFYGDGQSAAGVLNRPGPAAPDFAPFPGGNAIRPTLRSNFRVPGGIDADPIHLDREGYQYKVAQQMLGLLFARLRPAARSSFTPANGGWSDGLFTGGELRVGSALGGNMKSILEFDLSSIPSGAVLHGATLWLQRQSGAGVHPFASNQHGALVVDTVAGGFGSPGIEPIDYSIGADHVGNGDVAGSAIPVGAAIRIELDAAALVGLAGQARAGFRIQFESPNPTGGDGWLEFSPPGAAAPGGTGLPTWADLFGDASPQLDLRWSAPTASSAAFGDAVMAASPSPFRWSTQLRFVLGRSGPVELSLYDLRGRKLRTLVDAELPAGGHQFAWDGRDDAGRAVAAGSYVLRLRTPQGETRGKILRLAP